MPRVAPDAREERLRPSTELSRPLPRSLLPRSLRARLLALFALLALTPLVIVGVVDYSRSRRSIERLVGVQTDSVAHRIARGVADRYAVIESDRRLLSENTETQRIAHAATAGDTTALRAAVETARGYLEGVWATFGGSYRLAELRTSGGEPLLTLGDDGTPYVGVGDAGGAPPLELRWPVEAGTSGHSPVELVLVPRIERLLPPEQLAAGFGRTSQSAVVHLSAGRLVAASAPGVVPDLATLRADSLRAGESARVRFRRGDSLRVGSLAPVAGSPWAVLSSTAVGEFAAPFAQQRRLDLLFLGALGAAVLLTSLVVVRRATRSLEQLTTAARLIGGGNLAPALPPAGDDEVGVLVRTFDEMTGRLRAMVREIETSRQLAVVGEFAAQLSHEIRNPLTSLQLDLQGLARDLRRGTLGPDAGFAVETCLREVKRLDRVVRGVLTVGRTRPLERTRCDAGEIVSHAAAALAGELQARQVALERRLAAAPAPVDADPAALEGAVINLLRNAIEAQPDGGRILVEVRERRDTGGRPWIDMVVADDGPGIPTDVAERIFRPFTTSKADGTGLGLPIALRTARDHDGTLALTEAPVAMRGAAFCLALPAARAESA